MKVISLFKIKLHEDKVVYLLFDQNLMKIKWYVSCLLDFDIDESEV